MISGGFSHLVPLFVLHQRYFKRMENVDSSFLLSGNLHKQYKQAGINVLPIDFSTMNVSELLTAFGNDKANFERHNQSVRKLNDAYSLFRPDIIVDSHEPLSTLIAEKNGIPRISISRTGFFRSIDKSLRNPAHIHSSEKLDSGTKLDSSALLEPRGENSKRLRKLLQKTSFAEDVNYILDYLSTAKTKLIPGIPSIELLSDNIDNKNSYFYTGPLLTEDNPSELLLKELNCFFDHHRNRKKVFITTGLIDRDDIDEMTDYLMEKGYAVISTRKQERIIDKERFFYNPFLPLNYICSSVDLVIHQCGSGIYHYPILHQKPAITIGTQCYDI